MPYLLKPSFQYYAWGDTKYIQQFCELSSEFGKPLAEMWLGAHPKAPSMILTEQGEQPLDQFLASNPQRLLGKAAALYQGKLPFLMKVLAARQPLSIQVHPDKLTAEQGFARENQSGIALNDPARNFRDDNHKPELIMALTPFLMMRGFRDYAELLEIFTSLKITRLWPAFKDFAAEPSPHGLKQLFAQILCSPSAQLKDLKARINQAKENLEPDLYYICDVVDHLSQFFPWDSGIASPLLLNTLILKPGEAVHLDAGIPHAYIQGAGVELMANSDNVIRAGLTAKHIDRELLLRVADFKPSLPKLQALETGAKHTMFNTPFAEFQLEYFHLNGVETWKHPDRPAILLCLEGEPTINKCMQLSKGNAVFISATEPELVLQGRANLVIVSLP